MSNKRIIQVEEKVPFQLLLPLSIQHMFAMFGGEISSKTGPVSSHGTGSL